MYPLVRVLNPLSSVGVSSLGLAQPSNCEIRDHCHRVMRCEGDRAVLFSGIAGLLTSAINVGFRLGQFKSLQVSFAEQKMLESELAGLLAELSLPSSEPNKDGRRVGVSIG